MLIETFASSSALVKSMPVNRADSIDRRNGSENSSFDEGVQRFSRRSPIQRFSRSRVQGLSDSRQGFGAVLAKIDSLRKILAEQPVGVFVRASLPRAVRVTKLDTQSGIDPPTRMLLTAAKICAAVRQRIHLS